MWIIYQNGLINNHKIFVYLIKNLINLITINILKKEEVDFTAYLSLDKG